MRIISINREFGSGGRELGRRLAETIGFDYYDRTIIEYIARECGMEDKYIEHVLDKGAWHSASLVYGNSFSFFSSSYNVPTDILVVQTKVLQDIARKGRDCVIVGRSADTILEEYGPLKIFVYADDESKLRRCMQYRKDGEPESEQQMLKYIHKIDAQRVRTKEMISGKTWGKRDHYHLMINTSGRAVEDLATALAEYIRVWFRA